MADGWRRYKAGSRWRRTSCGIAVVLVVFAVVLAPLSPPGAAFPHDALSSTKYCGFTKFDYDIVATVPQASGPERIAAREGMDEWNDVSSPSGGDLVDVNDTASGNVVTVEWVYSSSPTWGWVESGHCNNASAHVVLNARQLTTPERARDTARHEIGHVLGAKHTGAGDGIGTRPTMATCRLSTTDRQFMRDDRAAATFHALGSLTPNEGFERGSLEDWDTFSTPPSTTSFFPAQGSYAMWMWPSTGLSQDINYFDQSSGGRKVQARVETRTGVSSGTAGALFLWQRDASYLADAPPNDDPTNCVDGNRYPGGGDLRWDLDRSGTGSWVYRTGVYIPHSPGWTQTVTGNVDMKAGSYGTGHTQDLQVEIWIYGAHGVTVDNLAVHDAGPG